MTNRVEDFKPALRAIAREQLVVLTARLLADMERIHRRTMSPDARTGMANDYMGEVAACALGFANSLGVPT